MSHWQIKWRNRPDRPGAYLYGDPAKPETIRAIQVEMIGRPLPPSLSDPGTFTVMTGFSNDPACPSCHRSGTIRYFTVGEHQWALIDGSVIAEGVPAVE